jgi:predicted acylesterase/phospholipase RssA
MVRKWLICGAAAMTLSGCGIKLKSEPMAFTCPLLQEASHIYSGAKIYTDIQKEGLVDIGATGLQIAGVTAAENGDDVNNIDPVIQALQQAASETRIATSADGGRSVNMLMLSGGGQWGAFGAGMMNKLNANNQLPDFKVITGVSTGALQSLLIATGDYDLLKAQYEDSDQSDLVIEGGLGDVTGKGALYDTSPLRKKIDTLLCGADGKDCSQIQKIANSPSHIFIGMVELDTGNFKSVDISRIARAAFPRTPGEASKPLKPLEARDCITGAAMASAAMPGFFTPVKINGKTYADGGVRYSLFEANLASGAGAITGAEVNMYMLRNGPTVLRHDDPVGAKNPVKAVDADPNIRNVALRAYSTIVNQSEVNSIVGLRLSRPKGSIRFATADGYRGIAQCSIPKAKKKGDLPPVFDKGFMQCLIKWGGMKADRVGGPWRPLCEPGNNNC